MNALTHGGVLAAIGAAALFGAGTPVAKLLLEHTSPWLLAGFLYLGSGVGLWLWRLLSRAPRIRLERAELGWLAWAVDNNLTRKVSVADASFIAMTKGLVAGSTNLALAVAIGATWPPTAVVAGAGLLGLLSYGTSLVLFVIALRRLGTARTG